MRAPVQAMNSSIPAVSAVVQSTTSGAAFLSMAEGSLNEEEVSNNTILSIAKQAGFQGSLLRPPFWFGLARSTSGRFGAAVHALPDGAVLTDMDSELCEDLMSTLVHEGITPKRIYGPPLVAQIAANTVSSLSEQSFCPQRYWVAYTTSSPVVQPSTAPGNLRLASNEDSSIVRDFGDQYSEEKTSLVAASDYFLHKLSQRDLYLWTDPTPGNVKTLIALSGRTENVVRIAGVFTPQKYRGHGYASAAIREVTNRELGQGYQSVTLMVEYTDDDAIHIYEKLGFRHHGSSVEMILERPIDRKTD